VDTGVPGYLSNIFLTFAAPVSNPVTVSNMAGLQNNQCAKEQKFPFIHQLRFSSIGLDLFLEPGVLQRQNAEMHRR